MLAPKAEQSARSSLQEELIMIAEDSPTTISIEPPYDNQNKTVARIAYEVLTENPYKHTEREFYYEVHVVRRNRHDLKIDSYTIRRSELAKKYGWGFHRNSDNKLALVACDSEKYRELSEKKSVKKIKSCRTSKK